MSVPSEILTAIGSLNRHARAGGGFFDGSRKAIYAYKTLAAAVLAEAHAVALRCVRITVKCNRCTNGRFTHNIVHMEAAA